jgi:hypothetical protein
MAYKSGLHRLLELLGLRESDDEDDRPVLYTKVFTLLTLSLAAALYLLVEGALAAGAELAGVYIYLIIAAFIIETLPDLWLYHGPLKKDHPVARKLLRTHYIAEGLAYLFLVAAVFDLLGIGQFLTYSIFMVLWLISFMVGEATTLFLE